MKNRRVMGKRKKIQLDGAYTLQKTICREKKPSIHLYLFFVQELTAHHEILGNWGVSRNHSS